MERKEIAGRLTNALHRLVENDAHLLEFDLSERCIASRLALYLQSKFPDDVVDVEYNRDGDIPKRLGLPEECANFRNRDGQVLAVPDVIVHRRGRGGPNLLVLELKKTTNPDPRDCDRARVRALREQLGYTFGALIECETRQGRRPGATVSEWFGQ